MKEYFKACYLVLSSLAIYWILGCGLHWIGNDFAGEGKVVRTIMGLTPFPVALCVAAYYLCVMGQHLFPDANRD